MTIRPLPGTQQPTSIARSLEQLRRRMGAPVIGGLDWLVGEWPALMGDALSGASRPVSLRDGVLAVEADDPVIADEIRWRAQSLCAQVAELRGDLGLTSLSVRVRPLRRPR